MEEAPMEEAPGDSSARRGWRALRPQVRRPRVAVVATGKARRGTKGAAAETALLACVGPRHSPVLRERRWLLVFLTLFPPLPRGC